MSHSNSITGNVRVKEASAFLGISRSTFWRWVAEERLPKGIRLGGRVTVWRMDDLEAFVNQAAGVQD